MFADRITTQRLVLRPPSDDDAQAIVELLNNWNVVKYLATAPYPYTSGDAERFLERTRRRERTADDAVYAITIDDTFLGIISVTPLQDMPNLGYWLGEPYWGQGLMSEAVAAMVQAFFAKAENQILTSGIFRGNEASLAVQKKVGFVTTGESLKKCAARGARMPSIETELTRQRYEELKL